MPVFGITGIDGFLGWHLRCRLHATGQATVRGAGRAEFADAAALARFASGCDAIVHLAGMNRGGDAEIESVNVALAERLVAALRAAGARPHVIFANSTHVERDTAYGRSKRRCAELFADWARAAGGRFTDLVLPGVYGECGRPFYNSVVSTFCHQLARGEAPRVIQDAEIELVHAQDVAREIARIAAEEDTGQARMAGGTVTVSALLGRLSALAARYRDEHVLPPLGDPFELRLFNTLRAYLFPAHYPVALEWRRDARGGLVETVKSDHGGQCFVSTTLPGITRGNHYHSAKVERFLVLRGEALIRVRRLFHGEVAEFRVSGETPGYVDMPAFHTHNITNTGDGELVTLFWAHEIYDPQRPDTYPEQV